MKKLSGTISMISLKRRSIMKNNHNILTEKEKAEQLQRLSELERNHDIDEILQACADVHPDVLKEYMKNLKLEIESNIESLLNNDEDKKAADEVFGQIISFLENNEWHYHIPDEDNHIVTLSFTMKNTRLSLLSHVDPITNRIDICVTLPIVYKEKYRFFIACEIAEVNELIPFGSFKLNPDENAITFEYAYHFSAHSFDVQEYGNLFGMCLIHADVNYERIYRASTQPNREMIMKIIDSFKEELQ